MVDPCGRRTTHADGARPSTNLVSSQKGDRTGPRRRQGRRDPEPSPRGRGGDVEKKKGRETDKAMRWKHLAPCNPLTSNNHSNSNNHDRSSSDRGNTLAVTDVRTSVGGRAWFAVKAMVEPPVQSVLTWSDDKVEKYTVTLVEGGHDVERATAILNVGDVALNKRALVRGYGDVGKGRTFVLRDPGARVLIAVCTLSAPHWRAWRVPWRQLLIQSVVSELDTFVS